MAQPAIQHYTFIDFENVPGVDLSLVKGHPVHVTILIGARQKKLDLSLVQHIHALGSQVELIEVGASGRNALDFTLALYLGKALERAPNATFSIISRDRDFDPMIGHLRGKGVQIARHGDIHVVDDERRKPRAAARPHRALAAHPTSAPATRPPSAPAAGKPAGTRRDHIISRLSNPITRNRPTTRKTLQGRIKSDLGREASDAAIAEIISTLESTGALTIDGRGRVSYR